MRKKTKRDWRSRGMNPGKRYYAVAAGRPEKVGDDTRHVVHYVEAKDGTRVKGTTVGVLIGTVNPSCTITRHFRGPYRGVQRPVGAI